MKRVSVGRSLARSRFDSLECGVRGNVGGFRDDEYLGHADLWFVIGSLGRHGFTAIDQESLDSLGSGDVCGGSRSGRAGSVVVELYLDY